MLDPTIDTWFSRAATTEADAKAAGFDSVDAANAALDAALTAAGFDPANAEHFTVQVNSSIGVLPNDRFSESGVTGKLTLPEGTRGKTAQTYYAVQMFTADTRFHKAGDVVVTPSASTLTPRRACSSPCTARLSWPLHGRPSNPLHTP